MNKFFRLVVGIFALVLSGCGGLKRLHQIDHTSNGYAMYRSGQPESEDVEQICELGVSKIYALNGEGRKYAAALKEKCPSAEIVYDQVQSPEESVSKEFLQEFDRSVEEARLAGKAILFHCSCGCHRTGRLAAYYRMKYQGWNSADATKEMNEMGDDMDQHPSLPTQVAAMEDLILGRSCSTPSQYCYSP
jgi:hypothetical protein